MRLKWIPPKSGVALKRMQHIVDKLPLWSRCFLISPEMASLGFIQAFFLYAWLFESGV